MVLSAVAPICLSFQSQNRFVYHSRVSNSRNNNNNNNNNKNRFTPKSNTIRIELPRGIEADVFCSSRRPICYRSTRSGGIVTGSTSIVRPTTAIGASQNDVLVADDDANDYLVTDSIQVRDEDRPSLMKTLDNPRDMLALVLIVPVAGSVSICNLLGLYTDVYTTLEVVSIGLGIVSGLAAFLQIATGYKIKDHSRRLLVNDSNVNLYAGVYALATSWLALRTSNACPDWLASCDIVLPWACIFVFVMAALIPAITLFNPGNCLDDTPPLSDTELLRARGLLGIGILASVFAPDCLAFGLGGSEWWDRVSDLHPSQKVLESSTSLFALYANEASMIAHRCGKAGVAPSSVEAIFFPEEHGAFRVKLWWTRYEYQWAHPREVQLPHQQGHVMRNGRNVLPLDGCSMVLCLSGVMAHPKYSFPSFPFYVGDEYELHYFSTFTQEYKVQVQM
eukprot:jgi/Psemu1/40468/gm1.40468_g